MFGRTGDLAIVVSLGSPPSRLQSEFIPRQKSASGRCHLMWTVPEDRRTLFSAREILFGRAAAESLIPRIVLTMELVHRNVSDVVAPILWG